MVNAAYEHSCSRRKRPSAPRHTYGVNVHAVCETPLLRNSQAISKNKNGPLSAPYACVQSVTIRNPGSQQHVTGLFGRNRMSDGQIDRKGVGSIDHGMALPLLGRLLTDTASADRDIFVSSMESTIKIDGCRL
ncbi:hypothetical protein EVAR_15681_1 [Eumeta japonica]|uniref:Uncharacterized protein n=1 Tax=Eumeta variegata TaxID=151549 RepID=A0A4C1UAB5_EUMVA|nr:hypothetical protein EVAR_15681_1 [Eumeta japonica]